MPVFQDIAASDMATRQAQP